MQEKKFIPIIDLTKEIKDKLEKKLPYQIDKKTVKKMIDVLAMEGLVVIKDIRVTIDYGAPIDGDEDHESDGSKSSAPINSEDNYHLNQMHM